MSGDTEGTAYAIQMRASRWVVEQQLADDWSVDNQACLDASLNESRPMPSLIGAQSTHGAARTELLP